MTLRVDPVFFATGVQAHVDPAFRLDGLLSVSIGSVYYSNANVDGAFGLGRLSEIDQFISIDKTGKIVLLDDENCSAIFDRPSFDTQRPSYAKTTRPLAVYASRDGSYVVKESGLFKTFKPFPDRIWRLSRIADRNETAIVFERNTAGRLESLVTPEELRVEFRYDGDLRTAARLLGGDGAEHEIMRWAYDGARRMVQAEARFGAKCRYGYDAKDRLTSTLMSDGYTSQREYDAKGRVVALKTSGPFDGDRYEYDDGKRITSYLPGGDIAKAITYHRDDSDLIVKRVTALGAVTETIYASDGNVKAEIDGNGGRTRYIYDEAGNLAAWSDPEGRTWRVSWDRDRNIERLSDGAGGTWTYGRDANGNLVSIEDPLGFRTDIVNNATGQPVAVMRHDGLIERRAYDDHHRLKEVLDFRGGRTAFERDGFGRIVAITDQLGATARLSYADEVGSDFWNASRIERADGVALTTTSDDRGQTLLVTDGEGRSHRVRKGACDVLAEIEGPTGAKIRFVYDGLLRLVSIINQNNRAWTFERDAAGRMIRERDVDGLVTEYVNDDADRRIETRHVDGTRILHTYDRSGLLVRDEMREPGRLEPRITSFRYDERGLVTSAENDDAAVALERDKIGRIIAETINGRRIESTFDCCGNRTSRRIGETATTYTFDPLGGLQSLAAEGHDPLVFTRDLKGRELGRQQARGFRLDQVWDDLDRLIRQHVPDIATSRTAGSLTNGVDRTYKWTRASALRTIDDGGWGTTTYDCDANGQVVQARFGDGGFERYVYDAALNVVGSGGHAPGDPAAMAGASGGGPSPWSTTPGGRVDRARGPRGEDVVIVRDIRGRVVQRQVIQHGANPRSWRYRWDGRDRLTECTTPEGQCWTYGYDPFARRVWKRCEGNDGKIAGRAYLWDRDTVGQEARIVGGSTDWANAITWHFEPARFVPLAFQDGGKLLNVVTDQIGTPREMFDESGSLVLSQERHVWGASRRTHAADPKPENGDQTAAAGGDDYRLQPDFQGQSDDPETGLKYNRFRHYDSLTTQYVTADPSGVLGGLRPHGYVHAPTVWVDPSGLYGVYLFETTLNQCYVGKGEPSRMAASMNYRTKVPPSKIKRCLYTNTDADAAKAGVNPKDYGALVENRLLSPSGYGATASPDWLNTQFSGQSLYASATPAQQAAATATAANIQSQFGPCP